MRIGALLLAGAFVWVASACHHTAPPAVAVQPQVDSTAILAERARARQDSIDRAEADARAREAAQRREDSVAALRRRSDELKAQLASLIHFDFDKSAIRAGDEQVLDTKLPILLNNPDVRIQVTGNCDERGSDEYNLALGNRRAITAKRYLVAHGVAAGRIEALSNGKERPLDPAHNPDAWARNRNDQFEVLTTSVVLR